MSPQERSTLAVFAPYLGEPSETFIRRHMELLCPRRMAIVVQEERNPTTATWDVDCPKLVLNHVSRSFRQRAGDKIARQLKRTVPGPAEAAAKRFLWDQHVSVILSEYLDYSLRWLKLANEMGIRFFAHAHGYDVSSALRRSGSEAAYRQLNLADGVITMSQVSRQKLISLGIDEGKVHVIPYGVDIPSGHREQPPGRVLHCLAVGRLVAKKGPLFLLEAFRQSLAQYPHMKLDVVGDGELLSAVWQFVRIFDLEGRVVLHRRQPNEVVQGLMKQADIFVQHSLKDPFTGDEEGLPVSILEAMAHGLPVLSTRHAGIPEAVLNGTTGYLVPEQDTATMAQRWITLAQNSGLRRQFGTAGLQRARELFSWERERLSLMGVLGLA